MGRSLKILILQVFLPEHQTTHVSSGELDECRCDLVSSPFPLLQVHHQQYFRLILAVSIERYLIVRSPFRAKLYWQRGKMVVVLSSIFVTTGLLTVYHHFEWDCVIEEFCNGTQLLDFCYYSGMRHQKTYRNKDWVTPSNVKKVYLKFSTFLNAILVGYSRYIFRRKMELSRLYSSQ